MSILLSPPIAFLIYILLVLFLVWVGRSMAAIGEKSSLKSSTYSSGELAPTGKAAPGYRRFFLVAFFFAILHLGMLITGSGGLTVVSGIYLGGLVLALLALILG
jgi:NADH:ubiquinone oxidoreductase subunit 3 (subunit A)